MARTAKKTQTEVQIKGINKQRIKVTIRGTSMLVVHKFSAKAMRQMEDKQQGKAQHKKAPKVPHDEFLGALHVIGKEEAVGRDQDPNEKYGFPACAIKKAMVGACRQIDGLPMTVARGAFHVLGYLVEIISPDDPVMRTDTVRLESGVADIRYRPQFDDWKMELVIEYNANVITPEILVNLLNVAGFSNGLGENRPEKSGDSWGMFEVDTEGLPEFDKEPAPKKVEAWGMFEVDTEGLPEFDKEPAPKKVEAAPSEEPLQPEEAPVTRRGPRRPRVAASA